MHLIHRTVLFVENSKGGGLASRLKELNKKLAPTLGFGVKVIERTGSSLKSRFPLSNLWDGSKCGREECTMCNQGAEVLPNFTKPSVLYENICSVCNEGAAAKKELERVKDGSIYVGESSRSIFERSQEHWSDWRTGSDKSHIKRHQGAANPGEEPQFTIRTVRFFKSTLCRQIGYRGGGRGLHSEF